MGVDRRSKMTDEEFSRLARRLARAPEHLAVSYGRAARLLLSAGEQPDRRLGVVLDLPAFFLIRHSVELALKDLIWAHHQNQVSLQQIETERGQPATAAPLSDKLRDQLGVKHDLKWLLERVTEQLPGYVSPKWQSLIDAILVVEQGHPEWSRYDAARSPLGGKTDRFDRPSHLPLVELVDGLEEFLSEAVHLDRGDLEHQDPQRWSALQDLALESDSLSQQLYELGLL